jgi:hypothetical protein
MIRQIKKNREILVFPHIEDDFGYDCSFSRQFEVSYVFTAIFRRHTSFGIVESAKKLSVFTTGFINCVSGEMKGICDLYYWTPLKITIRMSYASNIYHCKTCSRKNFLIRDKTKIPHSILSIFV